MNIILINHYAGSNRHGMEYRPYYLAREWVRLGHSVTVLAASSSHLRVQAPCVRGSITEENIDGIRYLWLKTPGYIGNGVGRALNISAFVGRLLRYGVWLGDHCRPDVVIASSTYPLDMVPAHYIARKCEAVLVFEVHDLWPLTPIELGGMSPRHPFIVSMQWAENFAYRKADRVVSLLPKAEAHMQSHGMDPRKFAYVPNGVEVSDWQSSVTPVPQAQSEILGSLRREGRFIVGYAGAHGAANGLEMLVEAAQLLRGRPVTVVLVGEGPCKQRLQQKAVQLRLANTVFLPQVPKLSVPALLASMDALYIGCNRMPIHRFGISPNKLMDYMMAGKPVIYAYEAGNDPVAESGCGLSVPPEDPSAIAGAVARLMGLTGAERQAMGARGKEYVLAHHDYRILAERFLAVVQ